MPRQPIRTFVAGCLALASALAASAAVEPSANRAPPADIVGEAQDRRSGELLYREYYTCTDEGLRCSVEYRDAAGERIAFKTLDYTVARHAPLVVFEDFRHDRQVQLQLAPADDLVVDAGFDNYVRSRWAELSAGQTVTFRLRIVDADKPFRMRAKQVGDCPSEQLCLRVEVDSWLLGLVAPTIDLVYDRDSRQLLRFSGVSNIRSAEDKSQQVDIAYRYLDTP